jgi:4-hydroxy-tetrahydrodipicolinate synthase
MNEKWIRGSGVALVTPFKKNKEIDFVALEKIVNHVIEGGVNYVVALGTTAETATLREAEKKEILQCIVNTTKQLVPVVCGIGGNDTSKVLGQMEDYNLEGIEAILSVTPYYNKPNQNGLLAHFKTLDQETPKPLILYNVPGRTGVNMTADTSLALASEGKNIIAIKEASGNLTQCMQLVQHKPEGFTVLSGDDDLILAQLALGFDGVISVAANCFTQPFCQMVHDGLSDRFSSARATHYQLLSGIQLLFTEGNPAGVKAVLHEMGLCENELRSPLVPVTESTQNAIRAFLKNYLLR